MRYNKTILLALLGTTLLSPNARAYDRTWLQEKLGTVPISLNLKGVTARMVLNSLAIKAGSKIELPDDTGNTISVDYKNTPLFEVFCGVLDQSGLDCTIQDGVIKVSPKQTDAANPEVSPAPTPDTTEEEVATPAPDPDIIPEIETLRNSRQTLWTRLNQAIPQYQEKLTTQESLKGLLAPKNEFESDFAYLQRSARGFSGAEKLKKEMLVPLQEQLHQCGSKWVPFSLVDVNLEDYDANEELFPFNATSRVYGKEEISLDLSLKPKVAQALKSRWDKLKKTGYLELGPGGNPYWVRLTIESPEGPKAPPLTTEIFNLFWKAPGTALGFHPDGESVYCVEDNQLLRVIPSSNTNLMKYTPEQEYGEYGETITKNIERIYPDREGDRLGVLLKRDDSQQFVVLNPTTGERLGSVDVTGSQYAFNPNGHYVATDADGVSLYSLDSGKLIFQTPLKSGVRSLAFSPNGRTLAVGVEQTWDDGETGTLFLIDLATKQVGAIKGIQQTIDQLAYSPDGNTLAVLQNASDTRTVTLVQPGRGRILASKNYDQNINLFQFLSDGHTLVFGTETDEGCDLHYAQLPNLDEAVDSSWDKPDSIYLSPDGKYLMHNGGLMRTEFERPQ